MGKQGISTVQNVRDGVDLVLAERDLRVHAAEIDMAAIILAGAVAVEQNIIGLADSFAPVRVFPDPLSKSVFNEFLLTLGDGRLFLVQNGNSAPFLIVLVIKMRTSFRLSVVSMIS